MKKLFIITGATGGMGYEVAKHFFKDAHLLLLDISLDKLNEVKKELGENIDVIKFDITNQENINQVISYVENKGGFDSLLHFAGVSESLGNSELIYKINLIGTKQLLDALYPYIHSNGVIINTSSMTAHLTPVKPEILELVSNPLDQNFLTNILPLTQTTTQAYGWSKRGVVALTNKEVSKWGEKHARILSISPGAIKTPMVELEMEKNSDAINQLIAVTPMKRMGLPSDIVNLVDFLISDKASFITGIDILIDGGATEVFKKYQS